MNEAAVFFVNKYSAPSAKFFKIRILKMMKMAGMKNKAVKLHVVEKKQMVELIGKDANVLSYKINTEFPAPEFKGLCIGDIYLNLKRIKSEEEDVNMMLAHGLLHLDGYDHATEKTALEMENMERKLVASVSK